MKHHLEPENVKICELSEESHTSWGWPEMNMYQCQTYEQPKLKKLQERNLL